MPDGASKKRKRTPPPFDCFNEAPIKIIVGPDEVVFHVHRERLCHYSTYFAGALSGEWKEAKERTIEMEESVDTFRYFVDWLYSGEFDSQFDERDDPMSCRELCELWVFADKRGVPLLQNAAINALHEQMYNLLELEKADIAFVYDNTSERSKLRLLFVEFYATKELRNVFISENDFPKTFLFDVLRRVGSYMKMITKTRVDPKQRWDSVNIGLYHERLIVTGEAQSNNTTSQHTLAALQASRKL